MPTVVSGSRAAAPAPASTPAARRIAAKAFTADGDAPARENLRLCGACGDDPGRRVRDHSVRSLELGEGLAQQSLELGTDLRCLRAGEAHDLGRRAERKVHLDRLV